MLGCLLSLSSSWLLPLNFSPKEPFMTHQPPPFRHHNQQPGNESPSNPPLEEEWYPGQKERIRKLNNLQKSSSTNPQTPQGSNPVDDQSLVKIFIIFAIVMSVLSLVFALLFFLIPMMFFLI